MGTSGRELLAPFQIFQPRDTIAWFESRGVKLKTDCRAFVNYLRTKGLLTVAAGENVMRVLPPLTIEESHIREFVDTLSAAAAEYEVPAAAA